MDNRTSAAGETSRKHREPLDLQPGREFFRETVASQVIILTILSIILGAGLGLRLTYPLLVPVVTAAMAIVTLIGFAQGQETWWFVVGAIVVATGLQFGYLAGALALLLSDAARRRRMGCAARERLRRNFTIERQVSRTEQLYLDLRGGLPRPVPVPVACS